MPVTVNVTPAESPLAVADVPTVIVTALSDWPCTVTPVGFAPLAQFVTVAVCVPTFNEKITLVTFCALTLPFE